MTSAPPRPLARPVLGVRTVLEHLYPLPAAGASPVMVVLAGLPGAGKSTLARRLAPAIRAAVLESDDLRRLFFEPAAYSSHESGWLFGAIYATAAHLLKDGVSVILDATNLKVSDRRPALNVARMTGAAVHTVRVDAALKVIEQRLRARESGDTCDSSGAGIDVMRRMAATAELPADNDCWHVNTDEPAAYDAAVNEIIVALTTLAPAGMKGPGPKGGTMGGRP